MIENSEIIIKYGSNVETIFLNNWKNKMNFTFYIQSHILKKKNNNIRDIIINNDLFIDPMTYLWLDPNINELSSIKISSLNDIFGENYKEQNIEEKIKKLLNDDSYLKEIVSKSINIQISYFDDLNSNNNLNDVEKKFFSFLDFKEKDKKLKYLVCPYFCFYDEKYFEDILSLNIKMIQHYIQITTENSTLKDKYENDLFVFLLDKSIIKKESLLNKIIKKYETNLRKNFLFWFDDLSFSKNKIEEIKNIKLFINEFQGQKMIMHADFLTSFLLNKHFINNPINKVITNIGYGESRKIFAIGGQNKVYYYLPKIHKRLNNIFFFKYIQDNDILNSNSFIINTNKFINNICSCAYCKHILEIENDSKKIFYLLETNNDYLDDENKNIKKHLKSLFLCHFVNQKILDYDLIINQNKENLINILNNLSESKYSLYLSNDIKSSNIKWLKEEILKNEK